MQAAIHAESAHHAPLYDTKHLFFLYDTGETVSLLAIMERLVEQGEDFRFIAAGSSVNSLTPDKFIGREKIYRQILAKRIELKDLGVDQEIPAIGWEREQKLSQDNLKKIVQQVKTSAVHVGTASRVQAQILKKYKKLRIIRIAYPDNFDYVTSHKLFETVNCVQRKANRVLCPSEHTARLLQDADPIGSPTRVYEVVGKPTLDIWRRQLEKHADRKAEILAQLKLETESGPIVVFMGGYDNPGAKETTYEKIINPLFEICAQKLRDQGYRVVIQPHPRVAHQIVQTPEVLAIADVVIGYNSSTLFDAAIIGKPAIFIIPELPEDKTFHHFSIDKYYTKAIQFKTEEGQRLSPTPEEVPVLLLELMNRVKDEPRVDIYQQEHIPSDSLQRIMDVYKQIFNH
jgi:hypothetical protein